MVDVGVVDVTVYRDPIEYFLVRFIRTESSNLCTFFQRVVDTTPRSIVRQLKEH